MKNTKIIIHILVLGWMLIIFMLSAQEAQVSSSLSGGLIYNVASLFIRGYKDMPLDQQILIIDHWQHTVRKNAHFFAYFVLGILVVSTMYTYRIKQITRLFISFAVIFLYAVSDEIHQIFVPGRAAMIGDVVIDTAGGLAGMAVIVCMRFIFDVFHKRRVSLHT